MRWRGERATDVWNGVSAREDRCYERVPVSPTMADDGTQGGARKWRMAGRHGAVFPVGPPSWLSVLVHGRIASLNSFVLPPAPRQDRWHRLHHGSEHLCFFLRNLSPELPLVKPLRRGKPICCLGFRFHRTSDRGRKRFYVKKWFEKTGQTFVCLRLHVRKYKSMLIPDGVWRQINRLKPSSTKFAANELKNKCSLTRDWKVRLRACCVIPLSAN